MVILVMLVMVVMVMANIVKPKSELIRLQRWTFDRISQKKNEECVCTLYKWFPVFLLPVKYFTCCSFLHIFPVSTEYQKERGMTES